jgi:hypothetical protein
MARTPQEIVESVLACIPDSAPEKEVLRAHFDADMKTPMFPNLSCATPEVLQAKDIRRIADGCQACQEVFGDLSWPDWKEELAAYLLQAGK